MYRMRGEVCIGAASVLSLVSVLLLIFVHVGQINTSNVPKSIYMVHLNTTGFVDTLNLVTSDNFTDFYAPNGSLPLDQHFGLRYNYYYGLYSSCGYLNETDGICGNQTLGKRYEPFNSILDDVIEDRVALTDNWFNRTATFRDSGYTGKSTKAAYWMILLGTICAGLAFITGIPKHNYTFLISTLFAVSGSILLLIGASIWTVVINRSQSVNSLRVQSPVVEVTIGLTVAAGRGLYLLWAGFAVLTLSVIPYMISCCTWRG